MPVDSGDLLRLFIKIGDDENFVNNAFGLSYAFSWGFKYDSASLALNYYHDSWFSNLSPTIDALIHPSYGTIYSGFSRTFGSGSGQGIIGELAIIVEEELDGPKTDHRIAQITKSIYLHDAVLEDGEGQKIALPSFELPVTINFKNKEEQNLYEKLLVMPNPADEVIKLHFNGKNILEQVKVVDMMGRVMYVEDNIHSQQKEILTHDWPQGIYNLEVKSSKGVINKKIVVEHQ
jgi:hypothetical protein